MYELPFGARLTDALVQILRDAAVQCVKGHSDFLPNLCFGATSGHRPSEHWAVNAFSRSYMRDKDLFDIDDITICIGPNDQARAAGRVLDWQQGVGVIEMDASDLTSR